jgi:hypothetical protein
MEIYSMNPIWLELNDDEGLTKTTIIQDNDEYLHVSFTDNVDDLLEPEQKIKIHVTDFIKFVQMLNRATNLL